MKLAIVLVTPWWRGSIDLDGLAAAFARAGHEPVLVCRRNDAGEAAFPVVEAGVGEYEDPAFWRGLGLDGAFLFSWLREAGTVRALRAAGVPTVLRADHDGQSSARVSPAATWQASSVAPRDRLRCALHWARRWAWLYRSEDAEVIAAIDAAHAVAIESGEAAGHLRAMLAWHGREALGEKVRVVHHHVHDLFRQAPLADLADRNNLIFCGGRWGDAQKDAPLLDATLRRLLPREPETRVVIAGPGAEEAFALAPWRGQRQVELAGTLPREELPALLTRCRFLLSSSRWETQPIGALEMLCMGGGVVAPPLPGFMALADEGRSGTLASRRTARGLAEAASRELSLWSRQQRDPETIAARWRARVSSDAVAAGLIEALS